MYIQHTHTHTTPYTHNTTHTPQIPHTHTSPSWIFPPGKISGLIEVRSVLKDVEGIDFVYLGQKDVVRHELVQQIIHAYEQFQTSPSSSEDPTRTDKSPQTAQGR